MVLRRREDKDKEGRGSASFPIYAVHEVDVAAKLGNRIAIRV
jgi:hypothetical protein